MNAGEQPYFGNAAADSTHTRGWFVGHFIDATHGLRSSQDVEIKWVRHPAGERRQSPVTNETRRTVLLLIEGRYWIHLSTGSHVLERPGDYVIWGPGVDHSWEAEADSLIVTIRWPSIAADAGPPAP